MNTPTNQIRARHYITVLTLILVLCLFVQGCSSSSNENNDIKQDESGTITADTGKNQEKSEKKQNILNPSGKTIKERFIVPEGYERVSIKAGSYAEYIRNLPLKPDGTEVHYYDGTVKPNNNIYDAVVDVDVGSRDLQQCADAAMRLRAEYLYKNGRYNEISFYFADGFKAEYTKWIEGSRIIVGKGKTHWLKSAGKSNTYKEFRRYMDMVFAYANTVSLKGQMKAVNLMDMAIGDILIDKGHSVIVMDMAVNKADGKKVYMLAQSYMPAQDIQILKNPQNELLSPWYELDASETIYTPQWQFTRNDLRRF